jgi:hypothetical protein
MGARVEYSSNNSGGGWWLEDEDWYALEAAGWEVQWRSEAGGRFLGALATSASKSDVSLRDAIEEWETVTGECASALGCSCCGTPHDFTEYDEYDQWIDNYSPSFPEYGDDW